MSSHDPFIRWVTILKDVPEASCLQNTVTS